MPRTSLIIISFFITMLVCSCSKKHHASKTSDNSKIAASKNDTLAVKKVVKPKPKYVTPKVIVVNDNVARKSIDGRLYYDLLGHRYWKNYKDGKYYLFNQAMYTDDAFKPK